MSDSEPHAPGEVESPLLGRLLRRTVGWPGLVTVERPRRIRLLRRAAAGRRPLVEDVARRWAVGRGEAWPGGRFPLAVVRVRRPDRISTEPDARERDVGRPAAAAPLAATSPIDLPSPSAPLAPADAKDSPPR